ncbi:hypothetical protein GLOTRDRAFT_124541 [Gloeophyllum trabeum ATCC 11539]|uniref:C3H1-type domain-containing protein n=1 Tax=Gloeophyllum trabeum (strain ATCC 11539 / FP-39264 / Madison 617) TaxID=670483 RepID=S7QN02_GLOTA|nr:uncharacterized protein GLOTRDRAFT_124541 [Gloeophyllum trabeum ATCC 11539]EPQ60792.1 hypothetical protein GLOTRDRAFT_124541 [Gloeophyllum trabeum ATCC 11539]
MEEENVESELWERLIGEQTALFRKTINENAELNARVKELEREVSVWKLAHKTADEERSAMKRSISKLERSIGSFKDDNPLVICLIDGDGHIFSQDLLTKGQSGGRQAAMSLTKGIMDYMSNDDDTTAGRSQLWLTIYCNKNGLLETLVNHHICTAEQYEAFVLGFNQSSPLFSIVDVGSGKEAADAKIKECLRLFTRFPQTSRVFFGGGHDNGYTSTLNYLQNEGLVEKIVLLRGYRDLASELKSLNLPNLEIEGVFMLRKLPTFPHKKSSTPPSTIQAEDFDKFRTSSRASNALPTMSPKQGNKTLRYPDPSLSINKQKPPPCNFYYLAECKSGDRCRYGHDYILTHDHLNEIRTNSKRSPCPAIKRVPTEKTAVWATFALVAPDAYSSSKANSAGTDEIPADMHQDPPTRGKNSHRRNHSNSTHFDVGGGSYGSPLSSPSLASPANEPAETYNLGSPSKYSSHTLLYPANVEYSAAGMYPSY